MTTPLQRTSLGELGGYNPLLATSLGELGDVVPPIVEDDQGSAWRPEEPWQRERRDRYRAQILQEDEELLVILQAFLHVMDD